MQIHITLCFKIEAEAEPAAQRPQIATYETRRIAENEVLNNFK